MQLFFVFRKNMRAALDMIVDSRTADVQILRNLGKRQILLVIQIQDFPLLLCQQLFIGIQKRIHPFHLINHAVKYPRTDRTDRNQYQTGADRPPSHRVRCILPAVPKDRVSQ